MGSWFAPLGFGVRGAGRASARAGLDLRARALRIDDLDLGHAVGDDVPVADAALRLATGPPADPIARQLELDDVASPGHLVLCLAGVVFPREARQTAQLDD